MAHSTLELIRSHVATGAALMARQKQIIAELKKSGVDATEAERTLASFPPAFGVRQWVALLKKQNNATTLSTWPKSTQRPRYLKQWAKRMPDNCDWRSG